MRTLDANEVPVTPLARLARDGRLLLRLAAMLFSYLSHGALVRKRYRRLERAGGTYWLDDP